MSKASHPNDGRKASKICQKVITEDNEIDISEISKSECLSSRRITNAYQKFSL
jgi:hypothetical protein